jgi:5-methylcytosine-specific restriction endonuclease McrA
MSTRRSVTALPRDTGRPHRPFPVPDGPARCPIGRLVVFGVHSGTPVGFADHHGALFLSTVLKRSSDRRGRRPRRGGRPAPQLTSTSTSRTAYAETRRWLLSRHGSVCAYCGQRVPEPTITLDHVTPRRGQSAYDRRDNLVLACQPCNGAKADMPILSFLLRKRERAAVLARYGAHLSPMLVDLVRGLAGEPGEVPARVKERFDDLFFEDGESPYHESPYRE